ncbi:MAG: ferritin-like domain-containing protein [Thiobacillaceae bacterium]
MTNETTFVSLPERLEACLLASAPADKVAMTHALWESWQLGHVTACEQDARTGIALPGRPLKPELVSPLLVPRRRLGSKEGRAAMIHAITHIEFNAINLALDAAHRFADMPVEYYADWLRVAAEEATHFGWLNQHLASLGHSYGDFAAHDGLWEMAMKTTHDPLVRMALVPRVLEARGLDATPAITRKLREVGDTRAVEILAVIERDEVGHVAVGSRWFAFLCEQRGLEPAATFRRLLDEYDVPPPRLPLNIEGRRQGGFSEIELAWLSTPVSS